jgi:hypothetical protein
MRREFILSLWIILSISSWVANYVYPSIYLEKGFYSFLALSII